jgi:hypothetical protein
MALYGAYADEPQALGAPRPPLGIAKMVVTISHRACGVLA